MAFKCCGCKETCPNERSPKETWPTGAFIDHVRGKRSAQNMHLCAACMKECPVTRDQVIAEVYGDK